ncbi:hypothetical protein TrVGV298_011851 [Trichoderma virens]|nr:hypothetical protein TrVGV298_011851 [Trichoderma virens]
MAPELPRILLLPTHLQADELRELEARIPTLTHNAHEAKVILGKISRPERALFELRRLKLATEPVALEGAEGDEAIGDKRGRSDAAEVPSKRPRLSGSEALRSRADEGHVATLDLLGGSGDVVLVLKLAWLLDSLEQNVVLPADDYLLYQGRKISSHSAQASNPGTPSQGKRMKQLDQPRQCSLEPWEIGKRSTTARIRSGQQDLERVPRLPQMDDCILNRQRYIVKPHLNTSPPNATFIAELKAIRTLRLLRGDQVGVRAYSTSIASLAAYPHLLQRPQGCGPKIAQLYQQWTEDGCTDETRKAKTDTELVVLKTFYDIWGVGDTTARQFFKKGWRDLDDIVEYGWDSLSRVQQIGVKYYDEFQLKIPRDETETIASVILAHARRVDPGFQMVIVGSYRRGKPSSGDVDVVLSHPDEAQTLDIIERLVSSLEKSNFITHTLSVWTKNSERGQAPLAWKGEGRRAGSGFDTLDKAMVVWQNPQDKGPHRRVDIIISPWKTAGCAILGWSGETTFQRDLRRYCKVKMGFKFDSSGVRSRADGSWVDLESSERGPAPDMETAERRVFEGLDLEWRPPAERCTG